MEGLFGENNQQNTLFQDKKKKDYKKIVKTLFIVLIVLILLSGSAYGIFYYLTEIRGRSAKLDMLLLSKHLDLNKYTDLEGLSEYFENINNNSYEFNAELEANSHDLNNAIKDMTKNEEINIKDFKAVFTGKVDRKANKLQTQIDLKHKENNIIDFQIQDDGKQLLLFGKHFFKEHIGFEKDKLKNFLIKNYNLDNETANQINSLNSLSLDTNYIMEARVIIKSIFNALPSSLEVLPEENFVLNRGHRINYRNNSLSANKYTLNLSNSEFMNLMDNIEKVAKNEVNTKSIEVKSLVGKSDSMVAGFLNYFKQIIGLKLDETLSINAYNIKGNIAKIEFVKVKEGESDNIVFEIEFVSEKNSNEIVIQNNELKLKSTITKDNNKIYSKIDIDGKIPIPNNVNLNDGTIKEVDKENNNSPEAKLDTIGNQNVFNTSIVINEPLNEPNPEPTDPATGTDNPDQSVSNDDQNQNSTDQPGGETPQAPIVDFVEDKDLKQLEESYFTNKFEVKGNINYDRPVNNSSTMNFNLKLNLDKLELLFKTDIAIKDRVEIENPSVIILLTDMKEDKIKSNMKIINDTIYKVVFKRLQDLNIMK